MFQVYSGGKARQYYGRTPEEAMQKAARGPRPKPMPPMPVIPPKPHPILWDRDRSDDKAIARERRAFEIVVTQAILDTAAANGWSSDHPASATGHPRNGCFRHEMAVESLYVCVWCAFWRA